MATLAEYYLDELYRWKSLIGSYLEEIDQLQEKLRTLLHSDHLLPFTRRAEEYLKQSSISKQNMLHMWYAIGSFERKLYKDHITIDNKHATDRIRRSHKQLRKDMQDALEEFNEVKDNCGRFIACAGIHLLSPEQASSPI